MNTCAETIAVADDDRSAGTSRTREGHSGGARQRLAAFDRLVDGRVRIERGGLPRRLAAFHLADVENTVEQSGEAQAFVLDDAEEAQLLLFPDIPVGEQDVAEGADRRHRRAHLVAHLAQELVLLRVDLAQALVRLRQFGGGGFHLARLALQLGGIGADLLGLVGETFQFLHADRLASDHARHQRTRGGGADIGRKALLDERDELVAGDHGASPRLAVEELYRLDGSEHAFGDAAQVGKPRGAADDAQLAFGLPAKYVDEQRRLESGKRRRFGQHGNHDEKHRIDGGSERSGRQSTGRASSAYPSATPPNGPFSMTLAGIRRKPQTRQEQRVGQIAKPLRADDAAMRGEHQ